MLKQIISMVKLNIIIIKVIFIIVTLKLMAD